MAKVGQNEASQSDSGPPSSSLAGLGPPPLPAFWAEVLSAVSRKWPVPIFLISVLVAVIYVVTKPRSERLRSCEEYVAEAREAFTLALQADDDQGQVLRAVFLLAGEGVNRHIREQVESNMDSSDLIQRPAGGDRLSKFDKAGPASEGLTAVLSGGKWGYIDAGGRIVIPPQFSHAGRFIDGTALVQKGKADAEFIDRRGKSVEVLPLHGVLPSYERAISLANEEELAAEDLAIMGESYYRLGRIKRESSGNAGRWIRPSARGLFLSASSHLDKAQRKLNEERGVDKGGLPRRKMNEPLAEGAVQHDERAWMKRRRMWVECQMFLGNHLLARKELEVLIAAMNAAEAHQLQVEKWRGDGQRIVLPGRDVAEWAKVYNLMARCQDCLGEGEHAAEFYRLFLEQGSSGEVVHRGRVRLGELLMTRAAQNMDADLAAVDLSEVMELCRQVEQSDAPSALREDAVFLRGRAAYRLGMLVEDADAAKAAFGIASAAFRYPYSPSGKYQDASRILLARSMAMTGRRADALEMLDGILRVGASPAIYACAEVSRADLHVEADPAQAVGGRLATDLLNVQLTRRAGDTAPSAIGITVSGIDDDNTYAMGLDRGGVQVVTVAPDGPAATAKLSGRTPRESLHLSGIRVGDVIVAFGKSEVMDEEDLRNCLRKSEEGASVSLSIVRIAEQQALAHGYIDAVRRIRHLSTTDRDSLVPELAELLDDAHFVMKDPSPNQELPAGGAQLTRIARSLSVRHEYDEAARIYAHILRAYPGVARDLYHYLLGELYMKKAERLAVNPGKSKERQRALLSAARTFMQLVMEAESGEELYTSKKEADSCWLAGRCYFDAHRYNGSSRAFRRFVERFGDDRRVGEALYLLGESLRRMGDNEGAAVAFGRCSAEHRNDQYGYLSDLALGETYLEMGVLEGKDSLVSQDVSANARSVFEAIRRDARYTPEAQVWMKASFRLAETYYRIGRRGLMLERAVRLVSENRSMASSIAERLRSRLAGLRSRGANDVMIRREESWLATVEEAVTKPGLSERIRSDALNSLRKAAEIIEETRERYPLEHYREDEEEGRQSFRDFIRAQNLPCRRFMAMIRFHLGELEAAHQEFSEILRETAQIVPSARAEADQYRREAMTFKGIIELRLGRPTEAAETFQKALDEYARTSDGVWYRLAGGLAREHSGDSQTANRFYEAALGDISGREVGGGTSDGSDRWTWLLAPDTWKEHVAWVTVGP